ncbi:MAG: PfkB family carbohydrate kinase [Patescibacteria group bacterium]
MKKTIYFDVIVVGAVYLDINLIGQIPLTPTVHRDYEIISSGYKMAAGGSSYIFAKTLRDLSLDSLFIGQTGRDAMADMLLKQIAKDKVNTDIARNPKAQTNVSVNVSGDKNDSISLTAGNANQLLTPSAIEEKIKKWLSRSRALYIGGYFKMPQLANMYIGLAKQTQKLHNMVILDHGTVHHKVNALQIHQLHKLLPYVNYYLPNQEEFLKITKTTNLSSAHKQFRKLTTKTIAIVKCGSHGAVICANNRTTNVPTRKVKPIYTVGAGDSFNAGLIYGKIKGYSDKEATQIAHNMAKIKITRGTLLQSQKLLRQIKTSKI